MNWLWIGDSHLEAMLPRIRDLSAEKGIGGAIYARSGWSSGKWLAAGDAVGLIASRRPDMVVYVLGTNDDPVNPQAVQGLVAAAGGRPVVWFGPFHSTEKDAALRAVLGASFISGASLAAGLPFPRGNVHLTAAGYRDLAARLVDSASASRTRRIHPAVIIGGTIAVGVALIAIFGRDPVYDRRWRPGEFNPFDPKDWARQRAARKR
jgi:hypothetical protein